jgi:integrase
MSELVDGYVEYKRSRGFKIRVEAYTLRRFAAWADAAHPEEPLSSELALGWIGTFDGAADWYGARLWETVRTFSRWACVEDARSVMLPKGRGTCHGRGRPYIYEDHEVSSLMSELSLVHSPDGLRAKSAAAMCGLMRSSGLRPSECCNLTVGDYDAATATLSVVATKFNRSRPVPLSDSAAAHVEAHLSSLPSAQNGNPMFPGTGGRPFDVRSLGYAWRLARDVLLPEGRASWDRRPPRPYDCRHTMITKTLEGWLASGVDVDAMMPRLSAYVGHRKVKDTYWYLSATDALLGAASDMFASYALGGGGDE